MNNEYTDPINHSVNDSEKHNENDSENHGGQVQDKSRNSAIDPAKIVNPAEDLVYKGGYTNDPEEMLKNPAVTPEMPDDQRDNRPDLTRESEKI